MKTTGIFITALFIIVGLYDLVVVVRHGVGCSVSQFIQESCFVSPLFNGCIFFLLGHWLGYMPPKWYNAESLIKVLADKLIEQDYIFKDDKGFYCWTASGTRLVGQTKRDS